MVMSVFERFREIGIMKAIGTRQLQIFNIVLVESISLAFTGLVVALFHARSESRRLRIEVQMPYHLPAEGQPRIAERRSYGATTHARRAFMRRYRRNSPELDRWLGAWRQARAKGVPFPRFIAEGR
jgi:hypothetical protein